LYNQQEDKNTMNTKNIGPRAMIHKKVSKIGYFGPLLPIL
tara:strand:+ start:52 stop:171 length:120 start_codon:yes stop_codon:yes gene_type:complete